MPFPWIPECEERPKTPSWMKTFFGITICGTFPTLSWSLSPVCTFSEATPYNECSVVRKSSQKVCNNAGAAGDTNQIKHNSNTGTNLVVNEDSIIQLDDVEKALQKVELWIHGDRESAEIHFHIISLLATRRVSVRSSPNAWGRVHRPKTSTCQCKSAESLLPRS